MPGPTITPNANLGKLRRYVSDVESHDGKGRKALFVNADRLTNKAQSSLLKSVINSAVGRKREGLALNMFYEALVNSYSEDIAAHVFGKIGDSLFNGEATLSTALIDEARGFAEARARAEIRQSELADSSNKAETKIDTGDDHPSGVKNEKDIVFIDANKKNPAIDSNKNAVTGSKKQKTSWFSWSRKSRKTNAANGQNRLSDLNKKQQKLADIKDKTNQVKKTGNELIAITRANVNQRKKNRMAYLQKRLKYKKKLSKVKHKKTGHINRAKLAEEVENIQKIRADMYLKAMDKGGKDKNNNDIKSLTTLLKDAAVGMNQPWMNDNHKDEARQAICTAFQNYDPGETSAMDHEAKTKFIVIPALRTFMENLNNKK